jgi:hypothetical protein
VDSDGELRIPEFDLIVGVFSRPHVDSERDGGDKYEDRDESLHSETHLWEIVVFRLVWQRSFHGCSISCQVSNAQGRPESAAIRYVLRAAAT